MPTAKIVLLGTGSPRPCLERSQPAQLIEVGDQSFVVDCGEGVTTQLLRAGRNVAEVQKVFLTHLHWDHILGYAGLVWGGWSAGRPTLEVWGPPGTKRMHEILFGMLYKDDVDWSSGIGYMRSGIDSIRIHEIDEGLIYERDGVKISATAVKHTCLTYAYRFEYAGKRIVFSGDTAACDALVKCAQNGDLLVQDTCATSSRVYSDDRSRKIRELLIGFHASPAQGGQMAQMAGVKRLVCTHLLPGVDANEIKQEAAGNFDGEAIVGCDLLELQI
jgi:ribonuclease BN (tRNA processing enzyme)